VVYREGMSAIDETPYYSTDNSPNSFFDGASGLIAQRHHQPPDLDFVSLISAVSWLYSRRPYLPFNLIDLNDHELRSSPIAIGSIYSVISTKVAIDFPSVLTDGAIQRRETQVVVKGVRDTHRDLFASDGHTTKDNQQPLRSFITELLILDHDYLYKHENIVNLSGVAWHYTQFTDRPTAQPRIILERASTTLAGFLTENPNLPFLTKVGLCLDIARGISALHACQIIHGDLKPDNVLIFVSESTREPGVPEHTAKLADFSHSFFNDGSRERPVGFSPRYVAPEVSDGRAIASNLMEAIDIYSLGVIFWEMMVDEAEDNSPSFLRDQNQPLIDLDDSEELLRDLFAQVQTRYEGDADDPRRRLINQLIRSSLTVNPQTRNLEKVVQALVLLQSQTDNLGLESTSYS
jgi:hypothetical protein